MATYAERHDLYAYQTRAGILKALKRHRLVRLGRGGSYVLHNVTYPYVKPMTRLFVERLSEQYHAACGDTLVVTSGIRPTNAQPWNSVARSVHPTGIAVDLRKPKDSACRAWLRRTLLALERAKVLEATEEFSPAHFHVAVYGVPYRAYVARLTTHQRAAQAATQIVQAHARSRTGTGTSMDALYTIRPGDTLWGIARQYRTSVSRLMQANDLVTSRLHPGQRLEIPGRGRRGLP
jgi:hypothetical protein